MPRTDTQRAAEATRYENWHVIQIRLKPEEFKLLKKAAGKGAPSRWIRTLVRHEIGSSEID